MTRSLLFALAALGMLSACQSNGSGGNAPYCGDGIRNADEVCEGEDLGGQSCQKQGFAGGHLYCLPDCTLDTSECSLTCGNAEIDPGEQCDTRNFQGEVCSTWGALVCDDACQVDRSHCVTDLLEERQRFSARSPAFVALGARKDGARTYMDLFATEPADHRVEIYAYSSDLGYATASPRLVTFDDQRTALEPAIADLNGDGTADIALVYAGLQVLDLRLSGGAGYAPVEMQLGCVPPSKPEALTGGVVWAADLDGDGRQDLLVACGSGTDSAIDSVAVFRNGATGFTAWVGVAFDAPREHVRVARDASGKARLLVGRPDRGGVDVYEWGSTGFGDATLVAEDAVAGDFAAADLDGDGRLDLVVQEAGGLAVLVANASGGFDSSRAVANSPAGVIRLELIDVDTDGQPDLVALTEGGLFVARNAGGVLGSLSAWWPVASTASDVAVGDLDGDRDLDFIVSGSGGGGGPMVVLRNKVR